MTNSKLRSLALAAFVAVLATIFIDGALSSGARADDADSYAGSTFNEVWDQVSSDPYSELPQNRVTLASFYGFFTDKLLNDSRRTLDDRRDLLPYFRKLLHPNGICLAGTWNITEETPYTGYFRQGSRGLIILRASTALNATRQGEFRAFGIAGKIFPTDDFEHEDKLETANFVTIEDLGGTLRDYFLDSRNTNDIIQIALTPEIFLNTPVGLAVAKAFARADETIDVTQTLIRQVYPISELGEADPTAAVTPRWMMITGTAGTQRVDRADFRDELRIENYDSGTIRFDIFVADRGTRLFGKAWEKIGYIEIIDSVASESCDHRLHFSHPRFRK